MGHLVEDDSVNWDKRSRKRECQGKRHRAQFRTEFDLSG